MWRKSGTIEWRGEVVRRQSKREKKVKSGKTEKKSKDKEKETA